MKDILIRLGGLNNWSSTFLIWDMYYLMAYVVVFSLPQTAGLGLMAGLTVLVMGGLGMAAPVQGGIGTYHALVSGVLVLYGISETDSVLFATVLHTSQTLFIVLTGGLSLLIISFNKRAVLAEDVKKKTGSGDTKNLQFALQKKTLS